MNTHTKYSKEDISRIIAIKQHRLDELASPEIWDRYTRHMESGEYQAFQQSCVDDEICIIALSALYVRTASAVGPIHKLFNIVRSHLSYIFKYACSTINK